MRIIEREDGRKFVALDGVLLFNSKDNKVRLCELEKELRHEYQRLDQFIEIDRILKALSNTWFDRSIKDSNMLCWYQKNGQDVFVEELLPEGIQAFTGTDEEWKAYEKAILGQKLIPKFLAPGDIVVKLEEVDHGSCPKCGIQAPAIKCYEDRKTEEVRWVKRLLIVCHYCEKAQTICHFS